jgi:autotransporter-associated beta strand protein
VGAAAKAWLKLTRAGDVFSGYVSDDGVTWTLVASVELAMDSVLQAGLAVTAHSNTMLARTDFAAVSGLPAALANDDVGGVALTGSGAFAGTAGKDDVALLAENTRWIGHALQVNAVGRTVAIGARDGGVCTFAGPIALQRDVVVTAPAGGAALFSGAIAGAGGVIKTGAGVVGWGGANTYAGATVISNGTLRLDAAGTLPANGAVTIAGGTLDLNGYTLSNGTVTIRGGTITGGDLAGTACEVVGANTLAVALSGGASLTKSGAGTLLITAPQAYTGPTLVAEGVLRLAVPGLYEGRLPNWFNRLDPNPRTSIQLTTRYANSTDRAPWVDNSTYVYSGLINNSATQDVVYTFAEQFDDNVMLRIDGEIVLNDTQWNVQTSTNVTLSPGVHAFDLRVGQGGWDVGPSAGGVGGTTGLGFACSTNGGATWLALTDSGAGNFLDTGLAQPFLPAGTSVTVADGATLDLNMATQTVAGVGGSGTVRNGELAVTGSISPAGPNAIGALTVDGNLTVGEGVVHDWTFNVVAADSVHVSGVLTLPAVATVNLNSLGGTVSSRHIVLYTFGSYRGPARLNGWTVSGSSKVKVDLVNREVVLTGGGTVMVLH